MAKTQTGGFGNFGSGFGAGGGFGAAGGDPFAPSGSQIAKFLDVSGAASAISFTPAAAPTTTMTSSGNDKSKDEQDVISVSKYAQPSEKRKLLFDVKMSGVNFSRFATVQ